MQFLNCGHLIIVDVLIQISPEHLEENLAIRIILMCLESVHQVIPPLSAGLTAPKSGTKNFGEEILHRELIRVRPKPRPLFPDVLYKYFNLTLPDWPEPERTFPTQILRNFV